MTTKVVRASAKALRAAVTEVTAPLSVEDQQRGWTGQVQRLMADWFNELLRKLESGQDLQFDYTKIARELDMHGISEGPRYEVCVKVQRRLTDLFGSGG